MAFGGLKRRAYMCCIYILLCIPGSGNRLGGSWDFLVGGKVVLGFGGYGYLCRLQQAFRVAFLDI